MSPPSGGDKPQADTPRRKGLPQWAKDFLDELIELRKYYEVYGEDDAYRAKSEDLLRRIEAENPEP